MNNPRLKYRIRTLLLVQWRKLLFVNIVSICSLSYLLTYLPVFPISRLACPDGLFGLGCDQRCACNGNATCDAKSGQCHCPMGQTGDQCDRSCDRGTFGPNCSHVCSCQNGASCDPVNGCCECSAGWYGRQCELGMTCLLPLVSSTLSVCHNCDSDSIHARFDLRTLSQLRFDSIRARFKHSRKNEHVQFFSFSNGVVANQALVTP